MLFTLNLVIFVLFGVLVTGSLLPILSTAHWFVRAWDFPRVHILVLSWSAAIVFFAANLAADQPSASSLATVALLTLMLSGWHLTRIIPYTRLVSPQVKSWSAEKAGDESNHAGRLRMLVTNVEQENDRFDLWKSTVLSADPDVVIVAEVDDRWARTLGELNREYPFQIIHPQHNWYGLAFLSRLPIVESKLRFLVQDDVPSIDTDIKMQNGDRVRVVAVHPRPPEPIRDNDSSARDAELVLWGREFAGRDRPTVIGGDLNDVAWSQTTRLFLRLSQLLDPRRGRGFFNTFHADHAWMRFPLDHLFHSRHFAIREIRRLNDVGSDHFPILVDLQLDPEMKPEHDTLDQHAGDQEEAEERIDRAEEAHDLNAESIDEADRQGIA